MFTSPLWKQVCSLICMWVQCSWVHQMPWSCTYSMAISCECWGLNSALLPELCVLLITEPSLQPHLLYLVLQHPTPAVPSTPTPVTFCAQHLTSWPNTVCSSHIFAWISLPSQLVHHEKLFRILVSLLAKSSLTFHLPPRRLLQTPRDSLFHPFVYFCNAMLICLIACLMSAFPTRP